MDFSISTLLDLLVLSFLAGTVFYALRLSAQLSTLKESKGELEQLVSNLSINITRAHEAIQEMQEVAGQSSTTLQDLIEDAQNMSQELQIITESGNNLAERMEETITSRPNKVSSISHQERKQRQASRDHFFIRDREFEDDDFDMQDNKQFDDDDELDDHTNFEDEFKNLSSRAEKQLASALRRSRKFDA